MSLTQIAPVRNLTAHTSHWLLMYLVYFHCIL